MQCTYCLKVKSSALPGKSLQSWSAGGGTGGAASGRSVGITGRSGRVNKLTRVLVGAASTWSIRPLPPLSLSRDCSSWQRDIPNMESHYNDGVCYWPPLETVVIFKLNKDLSPRLDGQCPIGCPKSTPFLNFASSVESLVRMGVQRPQKNFSVIDP